MSSMYGNSGGMGNKIPSGYKQGRIQNFSPEQMELFKSLFSQLGPESFLSKLASGDQSTFAEMEAPALRQFSGLQGNLASRFSGMGMGARRSSGFQNASNAQTSDFAQDLQSRRQSLQRQALQDLMDMSGSLLNQRPYDNFLVPKKKGFFESLFGGLSSGIGQGIGGGGFGSLFSGLFGGGGGGRGEGTSREQFGFPGMR